MSSSLTIAISEDKTLRARVARLDSVAKEALDRHEAGPLAAHALCRAVAAAAVFPSEWKASTEGEEERVAIQWSGHGKLGTIVAEIRQPARLRAMITRPDAPGIPFVDAHGRAKNTGFTDGYVSVLFQEANGRVTQGQVALVDGSLDLDLEAYFQQSQQVPTRLRTFVRTEGEVAALAVVVQALPGAPTDTLDAAAALDSLTPDASIDDAFAACFGGKKWKVLAEHEAKYSCQCSRERIFRSLRLFDEDTLLDMRETDRGAETKCEFCATTYTFDEDDLSAIIQDKRAAGAADIQ